MQGKYKVVIADTSCLILLDKIDALYILWDLFKQITVSKKIEEEYGKPLPHWISVEFIKNEKLYLKLKQEVDAGEASAIALALETEFVLLIIDDLKGRKMAKRLRLTYTGTLGVLLYAKQTGIIPLLKPYLEKIQKTNFRTSTELMIEILAAAGE